MPALCGAGPSESPPPSPLAAQASGSPSSPGSPGEVWLLLQLLLPYDEQYHQEQLAELSGQGQGHIGSTTYK